MPRTNSDLFKINLKISSMDHNTQCLRFFVCLLLIKHKKQKKKEQGVENRRKILEEKKSREIKLKKREYKNALQITTGDFREYVYTYSEYVFACAGVPGSDEKMQM